MPVSPGSSNSKFFKAVMVDFFLDIFQVNGYTVHYVGGGGGIACILMQWSIVKVAQNVLQSLVEEE